MDSTSDEPSPSPRRLTSLEDYERCVELQKVTWGEDFTPLVPASLLQIGHETGGLVAGVFRPSEPEVLDGFVFGLTAFDGEERYHWSHMLAVRPGRRGRGLGLLLKSYQRRVLIETGYPRAVWTFDPLESRNAHLNLERLGVRVREYVPDMYGTETHSHLHDGIGTDRLVVEWELESPGVERALAGAPVEDLRPFRESPLVVPLDEQGGPAAGEPALPDGDRVRIAIPRRLQALKDAHPEEARRWREQVRAAFQHCLSRGFEVVGLLAWEGADVSHYCLRRRSGGRAQA